MKKLFALVSLLILAAVLAAGCTGTGTTTQKSGSAASATPASSVQGEKKTYIVGIDAAYPPYTSIDKNGNATGFDVDSMRWIAQEEGFNVEFQAVAWDGIIPALLANKIDMVYAGMTKTPEREAVVNFSNTYWTVNQELAARNESNITMDDFYAGKLTIGTQSGCSAQDWIEKNLITTGKMPKENLKLYDNYALALTDLTNKRVDATLYDEPVVAPAIKDKPVKKIGVITTDEEFGVAIRKGDTELQAKMNDGLGKLMNSTQWQVLIEKYQMR